MIKKLKSSPDKQSAESSKKLQAKNPDKRNPNPDNPYEKTGPLIKKMQIKGGPHHPHHEEILDRTLK